MSQKNAIVTGSSNGIGEAIAKELAKLDYKLVVTGRGSADIKRVADECCRLSPSGSRPLEVQADLSEEQQVEELFARSMAFFADRKLHLLVNNAGYGQPVPATLPDECYRAFKKITSINLNAMVRLTLLAAEPLRRTAKESGEKTSVINIGSIAGLKPSLTLFAYSTSKAAVNMFTDCMAVELAPHVRVNCVSPGPIETKIFERSGINLEEVDKSTQFLVPLKRIGQPDEVARAVLFLANPIEAAYVTGANLKVDGGCSIAALPAGPEESD